MAANIDLDENNNGWDCNHCNESQEDGDNSFSVYSEDGDETWCDHCYQNDTFTCNDCESTFDSNHESYRRDTHDNNVCQACYDDHWFTCSHCAKVDHSDNCATGHYINGEAIDICEPCQESQFWRDTVGGDFWRNGEFSEVRLADRGHCHEPYLLSHRSDFAECAGTGIWIYLQATDSFIQYNGTIYSREYAEEHHMPVPDRRYGWSPPDHAANPQPRRLGLDGARRQIKTKITQEMSGRQSPTASPVHDKVYIGIELESQAGEYFLEAPHRLLSREIPTTKIVHDGSIEGEGWEFLPPVIKKAKDWKTIQKLVETLKTFGWNAHRSCGMHLHLSHGKLNPDNPQVVRNIFRMFYWLEPIIFRCLPPSRTNNKYCYPISQYFSEKDIGTDLKLDYWYYSNFWKKKINRRDGNSRQPHFRFNKNGDKVDMIEFGTGKYQKGNMEIDKKEHYYVGRYIGCNLHALFAKGTLELRYFPATLDFNYIKNWAQIASIMVMYGINQHPIEPIIALAKSRGNFEKAIKELGKILNLPDSLTTFLKLEYRKNLDNKEEEKYPDPIPSFIQVQTRIASLGNSSPRPGSVREVQLDQDESISIPGPNDYTFSYEHNEAHALNHWLRNHDPLPASGISIEHALMIRNDIAEYHHLDINLEAITHYMNHLLRQTRSVIRPSDLRVDWGQ